MTPKIYIRPLSQVVLDFMDELQADEHGKISLRVISEGLHERGFGVILLVFSMLCLIPLPGVHFFLSLPLYLITFQMMTVQKKVWLPKFLLDKEVPLDMIKKHYATIHPHLIKAERYIKPRIPEMTHHVTFPIVGGICLFITAMLSLPVPIPGTNLIPSIALILISIGLFMRDGLAIIAGCVMGLVFSAGLLFFFYSLIF